MKNVSAPAIKAVISQWAAAFSKPTADEICSLYAKDGVLLGTLSPFYRNTPELIKEYFDGMLSLQERCVELSELHIQDYGNSATCSGFYTFYWNSDDARIDLDARFTFVLVKQNERWLIAHHHSSALPKNHISFHTDN